MGLCGSTLTPEQKNEANISRNIQKKITDDYNQTRDVIKLILLGAGESGKSTIFKQMKILYGEGFSDTDRAEFKKFVHSNIIEGMRTLCEASRMLGLVDQVAAKQELNYLISIPDNLCFGTSVNLTPQISQMIKTLWSDNGIQATWSQRSHIQVPEALQYYFNDIDRITHPDYLPSIDDVLRARVRTSGIIEERYNIDGNQFLLVDVGGQRNERKKWLHCFDDVNSVIFVVALSEYDQSLFEEESTNRMVEAITIFQDICNKHFIDTPIMLFLNKRDLFEQKIRAKSINNIPEFSDYSGRPNDFDDGVQYFIHKFTSVNRNKKKDIFFHVTCATDTGNIQFVFNSCKEIILKQNLADNGFVG